MHRFCPGVRVRAITEIITSQGEISGISPAVIKEGSVGIVITRRDRKKSLDQPRVVVQFSSDQLVNCSPDMIEPLDTDFCKP